MERRAPQHQRRPQPERPPAHQGAANSSAAWRLTDRLGLAFCWALGPALLRDRGRDRRLHARPGPALRRPRAARRPRRRRVQPERARAASRPAARDADRRRDGDGDRRSRSASRSPSGSPSTAGRPALARVAESTIEAIAGIPSIVLALFGTVIFSSPALGFLSRTTDGIVFGRSFFAAAAMLSLVALPLIVASTREGLQAIPAARPRGLLRGRQDEGRDDPPDPAAGRPPAGRDRRDARPRPDHRRHGDHRRAARRDPDFDAAGDTRRSTPARHRQHAHQLRLRELPHAATSTSRRRPTRPPSSCC